MGLSSCCLSPRRPRPAVMWPALTRLAHARKPEEDRDGMGETALCCLVDSSERCRADRGMGQNKEQVVCEVYDLFSLRIREGRGGVK